MLLHAAIADRRMWQPQWPGLTRARDVVRLDLRGFGQSTTRPADGWSLTGDVIETLAALDIERAHVVGCSVGAGVAAELAVTAPDLVASLLLVAPGGALITEATDDLRAFGRAENSALEAGDLDAAAAANVAWWVVGPHRDAAAVPEHVRALVHAMQRRAFEITADWDDIDEDELDPPVTERLGEITAPTLVLTGGLDLEAIGIAADLVAARVPRARSTTWDDVAHLPSLERPDDFLRLVQEWLVTSSSTT